MKTVYAIKVGQEYVGDCSRPITRSWYSGTSLQLALTIDDAKHYETKGKATAWLKRNTKSLETGIVQYDEELKNAKSWRLQSLTRAIDNDKVVLNKLSSAVVVCEEVEHANYDQLDYKVVFHYGYSNNHKAMRLTQVSHNRYICKSCGLKLKNIPYYDLHTGNSTKICVGCLYMRLDAIKAAFEGLPEDFKTKYTEAIILDSL